MNISLKCYLKNEANFPLGKHGEVILSRSNYFNSWVDKHVSLIHKRKETHSILILHFGVFQLAVQDILGSKTFTNAYVQTPSKVLCQKF